MVEYYKVGVGKFIAIDGDRATVFYKVDLLNQKTDLKTRLDAVVTPSNAELLAWAKVNYPMQDMSREQVELDRINGVLDAIKEL